MSQRGSVRRRGATWTAYWFVTGPQGERLQRTKGGFRSKGAAQAHLTETLAAVQSGSYSEPADKKITVADFLAEHWLPVVRSGATKSGEKRRESTILSYRLTVEKWIVPYIGGERLLGLTPKHVEDMLTALGARGGRGGRPLSERSVQYAYTVLKMALDHAVRRGYAPRNVASLVDRPGARQPEMTSWTAAEAQAFLASARADRLYAAWVLFLARGPRRGELAGLRWTDVDLDAGRVRVGLHTRLSVNGRAVESTAKTRAGRRTLGLDPGLLAILRAHRRRQLSERLAWGGAWQDTGYVFTREDGTPVHPEHFSDRFDRLIAEAGVRRIRMHDARHTAATLMLADGTPVKVAQEMLGHASPTITQGIYQHVLPGMAEAAGGALSALVLGV